VTAPAAAAPPVPASPDLEVRGFEWTAGRKIFRCHSAAWGATEFNGSREKGTEGRFRPFDDVDGKVVPTIFGADVNYAALTETAFKGKGANGTVYATTLRTQILCTLSPTRALNLIDLTPPGLEALGLESEHVIETGTDAYGYTAEWAKVLYQHKCRPDGFVWISRLFGTGYSMILFGTRVSRSDLELIESPRALGVYPGFLEVQAEALRVGITVTPLGAG
jgi:hypothetical protein